MEIMIITIPMFTSILSKQLSKGIHVTSGVYHSYENERLFLSFCQHTLLVVKNIPSPCGAMVDMKYDDCTFYLPLFNIVIDCGGERLSTWSCPMATCPWSLMASHFNCCGFLWKSFEWVHSLMHFISISSSNNLFCVLKNHFKPCTTNNWSKTKR